MKTLKNLSTLDACCWAKPTIKASFVASVVKITGLVLTATVAFNAAAQPLEPVRLAFMDPLSGTFASVGNSGLKQLQFAADYFYNSKGGILGGRMIEILPLDNKQSPTETQIQFRRAVSEGIQIIFQGNSSAVANTLNSTISRHNRRNPDQEVLQINYSAVDPILTEEECSFWHFRFDAHAVMKLDVLTDFIALNEDIKSVYIIGQDYSFGQVVSDTSIAMLNEKRPDIEIAGNEFHPIGQVKDFTPYVTKIVSSGADAVITGNFGADMVSLARSIIDSGLDIPIYTFYAAYDGITATLGADGKNKIRLVHNESSNPFPTQARKDYTRAFKQANPNNDLTQARIHNALMMVVNAMEEAQSTDPYDIALALEDMRFETINGDEIWMRGSDHQIFQEIHVSVHTDEGVEFDADNSGFGLVSEYKVPAEDTIRETSCQMQRPRR
ncbi:MAG: branched-chain amino acid transport system substrate-binding protein [Pseudohongiellaceae bacterium]|jgi:branched-chain amino acid transport system substrate-binding protein